MSTNTPTSASTSSTSSSPSNSTPLANSTLSPSASNLFDPNVSAEHIIISYQDDFGVWKYLEPELKSHLPLKNISWKTKTGHTKIVEYMPVDIVSHDDERLRNQTFEFANLYRKPYLYLYLVHCDDTDTYKNVTKAKIRQWVTQMAERQQEWLIVYIQLGQKRLSETFAKLSRTVYDKIKNDFNVKKDRCCQLRFLDDSNQRSDDLWDDLLFKLKEGIISSAEQYLTLYEEEIRKSDAKRTSLGWNYLSFFFIKESLALIYERALLYEDAMLQYIELEVLFQENKLQFEKMASNPALAPTINDGVNLFNSTTRRHYRELIHQNKISLFDFKHYLFVCQSKLLFLLNRPIEVANKATSFITSVGQIISNNERAFPMYFRESWTIAVSLEIVKACQSAFEKLVAASSQTPQSAQSQQPAGSSAVSKVTKQITPPLARFLNAWNGVGSLVTGNANANANAAGSNSSSPGNASTVSGITSPTSSNTLAVPSANASGRLTSSQSLTNVQSMQLQSTNWIRTASLSLADMDSKFDRQLDRETLDFLLADLLFGAGQMLETLGIKLDLIAKDDLDYNNTDTATVTPFYKYAELVFSKNEKHEQVPQTPPTSSTPATANASVESPAVAASNNIPTTTLFTYPALQIALQSTMLFKQLYINVMSQADSLYIQTNRTRSHHRVTYSVAKMHFKLGDFSDAAGFFKSIVNLYSRESWGMIEYSIKTKLSFCQKRLNDLTEYITTCISLLSPGILKSEEERSYYLNEILTISKNNQLNIAVPMHPLFKVKIMNGNLECRFLDTITIDVKVKSNLFTSIVARHAVINFVRVNSSSEKLIFNLTDFTINPGVNHYRFSTLGTTKASFVKDSIWIRFGNVSFGQSLKDNENRPCEIKVTETQSTIKLESVATSPLLLSCIQYVGIKLNTHGDSIEMGTLSFHSLTGVTIIQTPSYHVISRKRDGTVAVLQMPLVNDKINLSRIDTDEQLELYLPVMAINSDPCSHQISVDLNHQKQTKEAYTSALVSTTLFINPFSIEELVIPVKDRLFLKIILQCTSSTPLVIHDYSLAHCDQQYNEAADTRTHQYYLIKDYNQSLKNMVLYPGHTLSLIFEINKYESTNTSNDIQLDTNTSKGIQLCIKYINKLQDTDSLVRECKPLWKDHVEFFWPIMVNCPQKLYQIETSIPTTTATVGSIIPFEFIITNLQQPLPEKEQQQQQPQQLSSSSTSTSSTAPLSNSTSLNMPTLNDTNTLTYIIEYDTTYWTISGRNKFTFKLDNGQDMKFKCNLIPVAAGSPSTPTINLVGINPSDINFKKQTSGQIYVYPLPKFNSSCNEQSLAPAPAANTQTNTKSKKPTTLATKQPPILK